jgi:magnesium-transporting ATPase (P-type)
MGLVGMIDPPRSEARDAVAVCRRAGIKPVMITGDHVLTASAIAKELGILREGGEAVSGSQLSQMSDMELRNRVRDISVYARVSPSDKIRIVRAWQQQGEVVAMTGDGVNDAPALKAADIGCAMGVTGTDVAKNAADMTLTDDNFATIVAAIREGRGIYDNIRKVVGFLLGTNIGEVLTVFLAMVLWKEAPLLPVQLLWINLVTDSLPAISLGMEPIGGDVMERKPTPKNEDIFAGGLGIQVLFQGAMFAALTLIGFWRYRRRSHDGIPHTLAYAGNPLFQHAVHPLAVPHRRLHKQDSHSSSRNFAGPYRRGCLHTTGINRFRAFEAGHSHVPPRSRPSLGPPTRTGVLQEGGRCAAPAVMPAAARTAAEEN